MAQRSKRKKKKRRSSGRSSGGGGRIGGMRDGIKGFVGQGPKKKESTFSKVLTILLIIAAVAVLVYRLSR